MKAGLAVVLGTVLGLGVGALLATATRPTPVTYNGPETPDALPADHSETVRELELEVRRLKRELATTRRTRAAADRDAADIPDADIADADGPLSEDEEVARRAAWIREQAERQIASAQAVAERTVAAERAAEQARLEDLARNGAMTFLRGLQEDWTPPWETLKDSEAYAALFRRVTQGPVIAAVDVGSGTDLADGTEIVFGPGRHDFDVGVLSRRTPPAKDIVVRGSGIDSTALSLNGMLRMSGEVHSLTFRDVTLDTRVSGDLERLRSAPYTLRLERCRVLGFDDGAGGSKLLGGSAGAFLASDCEFLSGFGRSQGGGRLFQVGGALLVRLERCTISGPIDSVYQSGSSAALVFQECRFESVPTRLRSALERPPATVRLIACTMTYADEAKQRKRRLDELSSTWGE